MIVDDSTARRLARAILADAKLYGGAAALDDVTAMTEARELFVSRVSGSLHHVFDEERGAAGGRAALGAPRRPMGPSVEPAPTGVTVVDGAGAGPIVLVVLVVVIVVAAGAVAFLLAR